MLQSKVLGHPDNPILVISSSVNSAHPPVFNGQESMLNRAECSLLKIMLLCVDGLCMDNTILGSPLVSRKENYPDSLRKIIYVVLEEMHVFVVLEKKI